MGQGMTKSIRRNGRRIQVGAPAKREIELATFEDWKESNPELYEMAESAVSDQESIRIARGILRSQSPWMVQIMLEQVDMLSKLTKIKVPKIRDVPDVVDATKMGIDRKMKLSNAMETNRLAASRLLFVYLDRILAHAIGEPTSRMEVKTEEVKHAEVTTHLMEFSPQVLAELRKLVVEKAKELIEVEAVQEGEGEPEQRALPPGGGLERQG